VRQSNDAFSVRLMMMDVISRLISAHQLLVLDFYSFMQKYLQPQQLGTCAPQPRRCGPHRSTDRHALAAPTGWGAHAEVTKILSIMAQASHELVPPDALEPVVQAIANSFVSDHCAAEVMTVGCVCRERRVGPPARRGGGRSPDPLHRRIGSGRSGSTPFGRLRPARRWR